MPVRSYRLPKHGSSDAEYEDAVGRSPGQTYPRRFAVADGASESSFARLWAELLVAAFVAGDLDAESLVDQLRPLQERWQAEVATMPLPWHATEKVRSGAFAAFAGLVIYEDGDWRALAVGDCCVLHLRDDAILRSFPLESAASFDNRPLLLSSNPERNGHLADLEPSACGRWQPGDVFLLLSDAIAAHVLGRVVDDGITPREALPFLGQQGFRRWAASRRSEGALRNDDVTLTRVQLP